MKQFEFTSEKALGVALVRIVVETTVAILETFLLAYARITTAYPLASFNFATTCITNCTRLLTVRLSARSGTAPGARCDQPIKKVSYLCGRNKFFQNPLKSP